MNPVVPRLFSTGAPPPNAAFTTVMNWQAHETIEFNGIGYGQKDIEFQKSRRFLRSWMCLWKSPSQGEVCQEND